MNTEICNGGVKAPVKTPIYDFLIKHADGGSISFHMPGHKGSQIYGRFGYENFSEHIIDCDITEIPGADNLFQTEGIIRETQERYARLYDVKKSYLLINGTSGGLIAGILASVPGGGKLIMARNCHKSVFNALTLGNIRPVYAYPKMLEEYNITGAVGSEEIDGLLRDNPDAAAVILPSPNYYGVCSDIEAIAKIVHDHGKILIVDQAHGAHLKFFSRFGILGMPKCAEESGADMVVNSIHKTLASFTQSAVLNLNSERIDADTLEDKLQAIQSTSPSYLLMASLDINASILEEHGLELMKEWSGNLDCFYENAALIPGLGYIDRVPGMDWTKLNFDLGSRGIGGSQLENLLNEKGIFPELFTGDLVMCMTGIGNTGSDMKRLMEALDDIAHEKGRCAATESKSKKTVYISKRTAIFDIPKSKRKIRLEEAEGLICATSIIPYPPGIPLICPGEKLDAEAIRYVKELREQGEKVMGVNEKGEITVGK